MAGSRTIKTLTALLAAMTVGAFALMLMQSDLPVPTELAAVSAGVSDVQELIVSRPGRLSEAWRNVILHSSVAESADIDQRCHFIIDPAGNITATPRWILQETCDQIAGGEWNATSVGVLLVTDSHRKLTQNQSIALSKLIQGLQKRFAIPRGRVYTHGEINGTSCGMLAGPSESK
jgi:hypothetical protein